MRNEKSWCEIEEVIDSFISSDWIDEVKLKSELKAHFRKRLAPRPEAPREECGHPSGERVFEKDKHIPCFKCTHCGENYWPDENALKPEAPKKSLAEVLHNARHMANGMTEKDAKKNWSQHSAPSQENVWGNVSQAAKDFFLEIVEGMPTHMFHDVKPVAPGKYINIDALIEKVKEA